MELPFAGLHQVCAPLLDRMSRLPGPQRDALGTAFGLSSGEAPDPFLVALAALGLLAEAAEERPLVCVIDDAQWLDHASAQALGFVARRLWAEAVALVFAARDSGEALELAGLPELAVEGLSGPDGRALLASAISGPLDERVRDRIVAETRGNPLALLELPRGMSALELAGGFGLPDSVPLSGRIEASFLRRLAALPPETRRLLVVAAAEPVGEPLLVWRAAERLGIGVDAAGPAEAAGLLELGPRMRFRHPLVRSAVYRAAPLGERQSVHRALAEVTDPEVAPDHRAWHRAHAAPGPDEDVAAELECSAGRAQARGGVAAAAAFLERATALTPDPARHAERALAAAYAEHQAGAPDAALKLLATAHAGPLDELQLARAERLHAQIAFALSHGRDVPPQLLEAAKRLEPLDVRLSRETYLEALGAAIFVGHLAVNGGAQEVAEAARSAPPPAAPAPRPPDLLLDGLALLITEGYAAGTPVLRRALEAFQSDELSIEEGLRWLWLAAYAATFVWDDDAWTVLSLRQLDLARDAGALSVLPMALSTHIGVLVHTGDLAGAAALVDELDTVSEAMGSRVAPYGALGLAAWRGQEDVASRLIDTLGTEPQLMARGDEMGLTVLNWSRAVLLNGLGRYEEALAAAQRGGAHPEEPGPAAGALAELVEAAVRSGRPDLAAGAFRDLSEPLRVAGSDWALGVEARCRALLCEGEPAEALYQEAIERLGRIHLRPLLARAHLVYGEWLSREGRRLDAREQLHTAHEMFTAMGIEAFAERAAAELRVTGEAVRQHAVETSDRLTPQEAQIARLARDGLSNTEIGTQLFISPRTVEYHLHKVFAKLEISSRKQLERVLSSDPAAAQPV
jgi:DNA-binding CsgD family transcriptional regulator